MLQNILPIPNFQSLIVNNMFHRNSHAVCRMEKLSFFQSFGVMSLSLVLLSEISIANDNFIGRIYPGFQAAQNDWIDYNGQFLLSNNLNFSFGFSSTKDTSLFLLTVVHVSTSTIVWTANRGSAVGTDGKFVFNKTGNAYLETEEGIIWDAATVGK